MDLRTWNEINECCASPWHYEGCGKGAETQLCPTKTNEILAANVEGELEQRCGGSEISQEGIERD